MIQLYWSPRSRSISALWLLEETGLPYERVLTDISTGAQKAPGWTTVAAGGGVEVCGADGAGAWAYAISTQRGCQRLLYDNIGIGAGVAAALRDKKDIKVVGWNAAGAVEGLRLGVGELTCR